MSAKQHVNRRAAALAPAGNRRHRLHAPPRSGSGRTLLVDLHIAGAHEEPLHRVGCNAKAIRKRKQALAMNVAAVTDPQRSWWRHATRKRKHPACQRPPPLVTIRRDAVKDVLEAAGDDAAEVGRVWVPLHRVRLAAARLPVREDGAVEALKDAVCRARAKAWSALPIQSVRSGQAVRPVPRRSRTL